MSFSYSPESRDARAICERLEALLWAIDGVERMLGDIYADGLPRRSEN
jgi:hypothetical protein